MQEDIGDSGPLREHWVAFKRIKWGFGWRTERHVADRVIPPASAAELPDDFHQRPWDY